jgi:hypothetical protein
MTLSPFAKLKKSDNLLVPHTCGRMYSGRCMSASSLSTPQPVAMLKHAPQTRHLITRNH